MPYMPIVTEKTHFGEISYDIFSRLLKERIILLNSEINDTSSNIWIAELLYLESVSDEDIYIYINSPGGSIVAGLALYDTMKFIKPKVITICVGLAASMAAFILSSGDKRYALKNSEIMIHQPLGGAKGQATDIKIQADLILRTRDNLNRILANNTGRSIEEIARDTERDNFMTANQALEYGLIDKVLASRDQAKA